MANVYWALRYRSACLVLCDVLIGVVRSLGGGELISMSAVKTVSVCMPSFSDQPELREPLGASGLPPIKEPLPSDVLRRTDGTKRSNIAVATAAIVTLLLPWYVRC